MITAEQKELFNYLFLNDISLLDVRSPVEFFKGAFPDAVNLPLLNDNERHVVGMCYKQKGQEEAIKLGHSLVSGEIKNTRINVWLSFLKKYPHAHLYCFRGGLRSHLVQEWLKESDVDIPLIHGGYKAMRQYLLSIFEKPIKLLRIGGKTGVGKTEFLLKYSHMVDLESLANHRGSAFGAQISDQTTQINFENHLAIQLLKAEARSDLPLLIEDEGRYIGSNNIPENLRETMTEAPILMLECSHEERLQRIYEEYVILQKVNYMDSFPDNGIQLFNEFMLNALAKIQKRLGGVRYLQIKTVMLEALAEQSEELHKSWISDLLEFYYDPMYQYQLDKKSKKVLKTGTVQELSEYLKDYQKV